MFSGFPAQTEQFLMELRFHNDPAFFHAEHDRYIESVQKPFYAFIDEMMPTLLSIDSSMEPRPNKVLARIHRDTRFTRDKSPYRDHLWLFFHRAAQDKHGSMGFWFEYGVERLAWGLGSWGENRPVMDRMRREFAAYPDRYLKILRACPFRQRNLVLVSDFFKRMEVPPSVPEELKPWYLAKSIDIMQKSPDIRACASERIFTWVRDDFLAMAPVYQMVMGTYDALAKEEQERQQLR